MRFSKVISYLRNPKYCLVLPQFRWLSEHVSDENYLKILYEVSLNKKLNLETPVLFTEKLQWLKLNDRKPEYSIMVDKYLVKEYVGEKIGQQYIIKTLGTWEKFENINFDKLPNQFVLKCNHDSNSYVICRDKSKFNIQQAKKRLEKCLHRNFYYSGREWPYKNIKPIIIAEQYLEDEKYHELRDYKFFTFNGKPKLVHVVFNRQNQNEETYGDFFDMEYKHLDLTMGHNCSPTPPDKPENFELMKKFSEILSEGTKHLRVDFYEANGKLYFGECTFYQDGGMGEIKPDKWNSILGSWIEL